MKSERIIVMKRIFIISILACLTIGLQAQGRQIEDTNYRRSSIYSLLINHTEQKLGTNIADIFSAMPLPDKYNDHDLSVKIITLDKKTPLKERGEEFLIQNHVASHMVAKWFDRNPLTGECNMDLVAQRGLYSASEVDRIIASHSLRGSDLLADAGEELIGNSFVIVNDIRYIDKEEQGKAAGAALQIIGAIAGAFLGGGFGNSISNLGNSLKQMMETLKGFKVKVHTHLYQLQWDEATAALFYDQMYITGDEDEEVKAQKRQAFEESRDMFKLQYVGSQLSDGSDVSFMGVNLDTPDEMIRKACTRAIDENVANLAKNFEQFKIKVRLTSVEPIQAPIGMKEEISEKSRFEVLQATVHNNRTTYQRVAVIQPIRGMIWDNRFMAEQENADGATLTYTTFKKVSGGEILPGMLIREISGKK